MSDYEELVERCCGVIIGRVPKHVVEFILDEVARTLENAPKMLGHDLYGMPLGEQFVRMLRASPLFPPDKEPPQ